MALCRNVGNLVGRVARNRITQEISSSKTSIIQAINLGRVAIASNHLLPKISPPSVERVTVEASNNEDHDGRRKSEDRSYEGDGGGSIYSYRGRGGANDSGGKLTDADDHGCDSGDGGGGIGLWEWFTGGGDDGNGGGHGGSGDGGHGGGGDSGSCGGSDGGGGDCGGEF